jgi:putative membrane protein
MENAASLENQKSSKIFINTISIVIPLAVVALLAVPNKLDLGTWTKNVTHVIGAINTLTSITLILGLVFIKLKNIRLHQLMMTISFALGGIFLVCYVLYHLTNPANKFTGTGAVRFIYLFILATHIGLSFVVLPLVLRAMYYAVKKQFDQHRKIVRFAYPIWLYVSVTGVAVYFMLYHLFPSK